MLPSYRLHITLIVHMRVEREGLGLHNSIQVCLSCGLSVDNVAPIEI